MKTIKKSISAYPYTLSRSCDNVRPPENMISSRQLLPPVPSLITPLNPVSPEEPEWTCRINISTVALDGSAIEMPPT
jgi:hypothetical protein